MTDFDPAHDALLPIDDEATQWRDAEGGRTGSPLLVLLHGLGSHEGDLIGLAPYLPERFTIATLRAPIAYGDGWAWHPAGNQNAEDPTVTASARGILAWLDRHATEFSSVTLGGFSQGGCLTVQTIRLAPDRFAAGLQLSGYVAVGSLPGDATLAVREPRVPLFWAHGDHDDVISREAIARTSAFLPEHFDVQSERYPMTHQVVLPELEDIVLFLDRHVD